MGGIHKYDLTPDVTHLIVGDYDTPKYRHVARERPDIKAMDVNWIEAVSALWKKDEEIPFRKLESQYQLKALQKCGPGSVPGGVHESALTICLTGFGLEWKEIAEKIQANGGFHRADLTRSCTHLIVKKAEGKKFNAARSWKVATVTLDWLEQSIQRGLILDEEKFDPLLPPEEQGVGAWNKKDAEAMRQKKRSRSMIAPGQEDGARKLRKTASMKLNSQHTHLWGDILGKPTSRENSFAQDSTPASPALTSAAIPALVAQKGIFGHCIFYMHGFNTKQREILEQAITGLDGAVVPTLEAAAASDREDSVTQRFLIVPQTSQPETHPTVPDGFNVITEMYIEKCLHAKQYLDANDSVIGRPFPLFPIPGFADLKICSAAFKDLDLNQIAKTVNQLGASFETNFNRNVSVLVCKSVAGTRKEKLEYARQWQVPVVSQDWLWECISTGFNVPFDNFILPGFPKPAPKEKDSAPSVESGRQPSLKQDSVDPKQQVRSEKRPPAAAKLDATAFDSESPEDGSSSSTKHSKKAKLDSVSTADFMTARSRSAGTSAKESDAPLSERSSSSLNKSPSPTKPASDFDLGGKKDGGNTRSRSVISKSNSVSSDDEAAKLEQARKAAKAAEREQLTSRITSLLDEAAPTPESGFGTSGAGGHSGPRPRKRQILGRATSNASSAGGSMSASILQRTLSSVDGMTGEAEDDAQEPPGTQLDYRDPQAQERRTALMSRLMGQAAPETTTRSTRRNS